MTGTEDWARTFSVMSQVLERILLDGDIDDWSRSALARMCRGVNQAAADYQAIFDPVPDVLDAPQPASGHQCRWAPHDPEAEKLVGRSGGIGHLEVDFATYNALRRAGIYTIAAVRERMADGSIYDVHLIGPTRGQRIAEALQRRHGGWRP